MTNVMQTAWSFYRSARLGVWALGDETGTRSFIRSIFVKQLRRAWEEAKKARHFAECAARADAEVAALVAREHQALVTVWANATPDQIEAEIAFIRADIADGMHWPLQINADRKLGRRRAELAALQSIQNTFTQHEAA